VATYLTLMVILALYHGAALVLNTSQVRRQGLYRWASYVPGWTAAAVASVGLAMFPFTPLPSLWFSQFNMPASECYQTLMLLYLFLLVVCLGQYFFRNTAPAGVPRSFIGFLMRLVFGRGSTHETMQLIRACEYSVFGTFGASFIPPLMKMSGYYSSPATKQDLPLATLGAGMVSMVILWLIRRSMGEPKLA